MEIHQDRCLAPDPIREPEKCAGLRASFTIISVLGIGFFVLAALALCSPSVYSFLETAISNMTGSGAPDPLALQHGSSLPIFSD